MEVKVESLESWRIITLKGRFIVRSLALIRRHFEEAEKASRPSVALDMSGVSQLDSSAITLLVNFQRRIIRKEGIVVLFGLRSDVAEMFSVIGIDKMFRICSSRQDFENMYGSSER